MSQDEDAQILTQLGLTNRQAKVYLTLNGSKEGTVKTIAAAASIDRANVYRAMSQLVNLGLVEKEISNPVVFKATLIHEVIPMLLQHKKREYEKIEEKTKKLLKRCKENNETPDEECRLVLIPRGRATERKAIEMLDRLQKSYDFIFSWREFKPEIAIAIRIWKNLIRKGIRIRLIIYTPEERPTKNVLRLGKKDLFEVRYTSTSPPITLMICDRKAVFATISPPLDPMKTPSLCSNNPGLVAVFENCFEMLWLNSTENKHTKNKKAPCVNNQTVT